MLEWLREHAPSKRVRVGAVVISFVGFVVAIPGYLEDLGTWADWLNAVEGDAVRWIVLAMSLVLVIAAVFWPRPKLETHSQSMSVEPLRLGVQLPQPTVLATTWRQELRELIDQGTALRREPVPTDVDLAAWNTKMDEWSLSASEWLHDRSPAAAVEFNDRGSVQVNLPVVPEQYNSHHGRLCVLLDRRIRVLESYLGSVPPSVPLEGDQS